MPDVEPVVIRVEAKGAPEAAQGVKHAGDSLGELSERVGQMAQGFAQGNVSVLSFLRNLRSMRGLVMEAAEALGVLKAAEEASVYQRLELGFQGLAGNAAVGTEIVEQVERIARTTGYATAQLGEYARALMAVGVTSRDIAPDMKALTDFASRFGLQPEQMGLIATGLIQQVTMPTLSSRTGRAFAEAGLNIQQIVGAGLGHPLPSQQAAVGALSAMMPMDRLAVIFRGMERVAPNAGQAMLWGRLDLAMAAVGEQLRQILLPTGLRLVEILAPIGTGLAEVLDVFRRINDAGKGFPGLALVLGIVGPAILRIGQAAWQAITAIGTLTTAIQGLAGASATAASTTSGSALVPYAAGAAGVAGAAAVSDAGIGAFLLRFIKSPFGVALALNLLGMVASATGHPDLGTVLSDVSSGAAIGGALASVIPGIGTAVGAGIGGGIGLGAGLWGTLRGSSASDKLGEIADNTRQTAQVLQDIHVSVIGGGPRGRHAALDIEMLRARQFALGGG